MVSANELAKRGDEVEKIAEQEASMRSTEARVRMIQVTTIPAVLARKVLLLKRLLLATCCAYVMFGGVKMALENRSYPYRTLYGTLVCILY